MQKSANTFTQFEVPQAFIGSLILAALMRSSYELKKTLLTDTKELIEDKAPSLKIVEIAEKKDKEKKEANVKNASFDLWHFLNEKVVEPLFVTPTQFVGKEVLGNMLLRPGAMVSGGAAGFLLADEILDTLQKNKIKKQKENARKLFYKSLLNEKNDIELKEISLVDTKNNKKEASEGSSQNDSKFSIVGDLMRLAAFGSLVGIPVTLAWATKQYLDESLPSVITPKKKKEKSLEEKIPRVVKLSSLLHKPEVSAILRTSIIKTALADPAMEESITNNIVKYVAWHGISELNQAIKSATLKEFYADKLEKKLAETQNKPLTFQRKQRAIEALAGSKLCGNHTVKIACSEWTDKRPSILQFAEQLKGNEEANVDILTKGLTELLVMEKNAGDKLTPLAYIKMASVPSAEKHAQIVSNFLTAWQDVSNPLYLSAKVLDN